MLAAVVLMTVGALAVIPALTGVLGLLAEGNLS